MGVPRWEVVVDQLRSSFSMSDRPPSDSQRPQLRDLIVVLKGVTAWHDLGLHLGLPESTLAVIALHHDTSGHLRMMLSNWLSFDNEASWEKLATALNKIGENVIAADVRRQFVINKIASDPSPSSEQEAKRRTCV